MRGRRCRPLFDVIARLDRAIQYSRGGAAEPRSRGVLGPPIKSGDDGGGCGKAFPRHHMPEFCSVHCHPQPRGRRECRMLAAPASLACKEKCTLRTQAASGQPDNRHSLRNGLRLIRVLLGAPGFWPPSPCGSSPQDLIPASGDRDRTISPSAFARLVVARNCVHRIPRRVR
jgi:hypothetical protein